VGIEARPRQVDTLRIEVPATADRLVQIRHRLLAWIEPIGVPDAVAADIVLAVNEACTNSVEHAYRDSNDGVIEVEASLKDGSIIVCVSDHGSWLTPSGQPTTRGRGLPIIEATSENLELFRSEAGTTVRITFRTEPTAQECGSRTT
jgi:anti-sigma regulatory factor (Ser/Thr protein kinase)